MKHLHGNVQSHGCTVCRFTGGNNQSSSRKEKKKAQNSSICVTLICECESRSAAGTSALPTDEPTGSRQREREGEKKKTNLREPSGDPGLSACGSVCLHAKCAVTEGEQESNNPSTFHQAAPSLRQKPFWNISEKKQQTTNFPDHQLFSKQLTKLDQRQYSIFLANHVSASGNMSENGLGEVVK